MKRSEIQAAIADAKALLENNKIKLPMFGYWKLEEWKAHKASLGTIRQTKLGWDVTDFGSDEFKKTGAVLFTIRNGILGKPEVGCPYAEKLIIIKDDQVLPLHFHHSKTEDIINHLSEEKIRIVFVSKIVTGDQRKSQRKKHDLI